MTPAADPQENNVANLSNRGFVVRRRFLDDGELVRLRSDFAAVGMKANRNYAIKQASRQAVDRIRSSLVALATEVARDTDIVVDRVSGATYFSTALGFDSSLHQDHESYFLFQQHYHYLNFWIPIDKPDPARTNLAVVPLDVLRARSPHVAAKLLGRGAVRTRPGRRGSELLLDETGEIIPLGFELRELEVCPELCAGDLLLLRGDLLHRTQDTATERTAVSFRMLRASAPISSLRLLTGSTTKRRMMMNNPWDYVRALRVINGAGKGEVSAGDLLDSFERGGNDPLGTLRALAQLAFGWRRR